MKAGSCTLFKKRQLSNAVNSRHARIILLSRGGLCNREIAQGVGLSPQWVRRIIHRFNDGGITWYPYFCSCGEPRQFTAEVVERIGEVALSPPRQLIGMSVWSLAKLREYLVEQGIVASISLEWLRQILRGGGIRWRHTKTWKDSDDPEFWLKHRRIRRLYDHPPRGGVRLCVDESGPLNLLPRHASHRPRQRHLPRLSRDPRLRQGQRHPLLLDTHERFVDQSDRVPLHCPAEVRARQYRLQEPRRDAGRDLRLSRLAQLPAQHQHAGVDRLPPKGGGVSRIMGAKPSHWKRH